MAQSFLSLSMNDLCLLLLSKKTFADIDELQKDAITSNCVFLPAATATSQAGSRPLHFFLRFFPPNVGFIQSFYFAVS